MDSYSQALGYGWFCGRNCAERKIAAGIPPIGARRASKAQDATSDAVTGVVVGSLLAIAVMVVIIKKAKK